jgi:hypothetical protein
MRSGNMENPNDHDLLVTLNAKMEGLRADIQALSDGTATKIANHEARLNNLETNNVRLNVLLTIGISILSVLIGLLVWHIFKTGV